MKPSLVALLIALCVALAAEAQAEKPATFVGVSANTTLGNAGGVLGMHAQCQATHGKKARMCTTRDLVNGLTAKTPLSANAWIHAVPVAVYGDDDALDVTGARLSSDPPNCSGWTSTAGQAVFVGGAGFSLTLSICNSFRTVACCQ